jgi:hypothetical protein
MSPSGVRVRAAGGGSFKNHSERESSGKKTAPIALGAKKENEHDASQ